jgi:hypothetical protein
VRLGSSLSKSRNVGECKAIIVSVQNTTLENVLQAMVASMAV